MYDPNYVRNDSLVISLHVVPASPIMTQHWYGRPDTAVTYPRRGVTTVLLKMHLCDAWESNPCAQMYAAWRRLYATYAPRGVDFVILLQTRGSFGLSTRLPAQAEADSLRAYFVDHLKLPGIVGVTETPFTTLPDGRKVAAGGAPDYRGVVTRDGMYWPLGFEQISGFLKNHQ
jgi:hypothetical protein